MEKIKTSNLIKYAIVVATIIGVALSFIFAKTDGYKNWHFRLMYFTLQSNLWIGITAFLYLLPVFNRNEKLKEGLYVCKYIFTVSITVTGIVFCFLLAPFAHKDGYNAFTASSVLLHAVVPILAIVDYFADEYRIELERKHLFYSILPPLIYFVIASAFCLARVDFGRGDPYPYFFMNYYSSVGVFGIGGEPPFVIGTAYWIIIFLLFVLTLGLIYYKINKRFFNNKNKDRKNA